MKVLLTFAVNIVWLIECYWVVSLLRLTTKVNKIFGRSSTKKDSPTIAVNMMSLTLLLSNELDTKFAEIDHFMWRRKSQSVTISIVYNSCHLLIIQFSIAKHKVEYIVKGKKTSCVCVDIPSNRMVCVRMKGNSFRKGVPGRHIDCSQFSLANYVSILPFCTHLSAFVRGSANSGHKEKGHSHIWTRPKP